MAPQHCLRTTPLDKVVLVSQWSASYAVVVLNHEHKLGPVAIVVSDKLDILNFVCIVSPTCFFVNDILSHERCFCYQLMHLVDGITTSFAWLRNLSHFGFCKNSRKQEDWLLKNLVLLIPFWELVSSEPWVGFETHKSDFALPLHKEHDITVRLSFELENLLLNHLCMIDKGNKFPFTKVDDFLRDVHCHVNYANLIVLRRVVFVCKERVVYYICLCQRTLWIVQVIFLALFSI